MTNEELDHLERCEAAMKQARDACALQLRRWRDGEEVCAVSELQEAHNACTFLVGKAEERGNNSTKEAELLPVLMALVAAVGAVISAENAINYEEGATEEQQDELFQAYALQRHALERAEVAIGAPRPELSSRNPTHS